MRVVAVRLRCSADVGGNLAKDGRECYVLRRISVSYTPVTVATPLSLRNLDIHYLGVPKKRLREQELTSFAEPIDH